MRASIATFSLTLLLSVSGCAIIPKPGKTEPGVVNAAAWKTRQARVESLYGWSLQGRVATGQLLGWTGNLSWRERGPRFHVRLSGPVGAGGFRADGTLERVVIQTRDRRLVTRSPDALVESELGWQFPLEPLRYWARGLPAPGDYASISVNENGRLKGLNQNGWRLTFPKYRDVDGAPALPRRIVMDNGKNRIRLVVDRWFDIQTAAPSN